MRTTIKIDDFIFPNGVGRVDISSSIRVVERMNAFMWLVSTEVEANVPSLYPFLWNVDRS